MSVNHKGNERQLRKIMEKDRYLKREYLYRTANKELFIGPIAHSIKQKLIRRNSG